MTSTPNPQGVSRYYVLWHDYPSAVAANNGDKEAAAAECHNHIYDRIQRFEKFRPAVTFAHSKVGDDFFGCPRVYREVLIAEDDWEDFEFWDCDDPVEPVFEARPTEQVRL